MPQRLALGALRNVAFILVVACAGAHTATAQTITGVVVLPDHATAIAGAIVVATDDRGQSTRALSAESGRFSLHLSHSGRFTLRVLRIGFRPSDGPTLDVGAASTIDATLVADGLPVSLAAISSRATEVCQVHPDTGLLVARAWEEAQKAMTAAQIGAPGESIEASWVEYDRMLDSSGRRVSEQSVRLATHPTTHAFKSASADVLDRYGYVVTDSTGTTFFAPDPDVLLSDQFAAGHCFRLAQSPIDQPRRLGVAFEPTRERDGVRDVKGTIWLDRATSTLLSLDFSYTNLPDEAIAAGAGGHIAFGHLTGGTWLIQSWQVRFPILQKVDAIRDGGARRLVYATNGLAVKAIQVTGGEVTVVRRGDSTLFQSQGPRVTLQLVEHDSLVRARGARLSLDGTNYEAVADANGLAQIQPAIDGVYLARIHVPVLDTLGAPPLEREVSVHTNGVIDSLSLPSANEVLDRLCTKDVSRNGQALLHGSVADQQGRPLSDVVVTASWRRLTDASQRQSGGAAVLENSVHVSTDNNGQWRLCGVPRGIALTVRASADAGLDVQRKVVAGTEAWSSVALVVRPAIASATTPDTIGYANLAFLVANASGAPIPDVALSAMDVAGVAHRVSTDSTGRADLPNVPAGRVSIQARRIGFTPGTVVATLLAGSDTLPLILSDVAAPQLDTVRVVAARGVNAHHDAFDTRLRQHIATAAFSMADIDKRNPADVWQLFSSVPSVTVTQTGSLVTLETSRGQVLKNNAMVACSMLVAIDGVVLNPGAGSVNANELPRPNEIYGIEVFAGAATIPLQYASAAGGMACGLIAIWTR